MAAVSFSEAAKVCGHRSRSTLYRMRDDGRLAGYLRPGGKNGAQLLELHPEGRPSLVDWCSVVVGPQSPTGPLSRSAADLQERRRELEQRRRWEAVAGGLTDALLAQGLALSLTRQEAQALTDALPGVLAEVMGAEGLELLGVAIGGPPAPADPLAAADGGEAFWAEWGRIAGPDEPPLSDAQFWANVLPMLGGMWAGSLPIATPQDLAELSYQLRDVEAAVEAGARWDAGRWAVANVRNLLECLPCDVSAAELLELLEAGEVPPALLPEVEAALAQQAAAA